MKPNPYDFTDKEPTVKEQVYKDIRQHPLPWILLTLLALFTLSFYAHFDVEEAWNEVHGLVAIGVPVGILLEGIGAARDAWDEGKNGGA